VSAQKAKPAQPAKRPAAAKTPAKATAKASAATKAAATKTASPTASTKTAAKAPTKATTKPSAATKAAAGKATTAKAPAKGQAKAPEPAIDAKAARSVIDKKTIAALRKLLEAERANLQSQADALEEERRRLALDRDSSDDNFTEESGEGATTTMEQEKDLSLAANVADLIEKVDASLERMDDGTYGLCERCGKPIGKPRLEALPWAALCIQCKQKEEHRFF
jgi:RNA polymerase-binding protein DksA